MSDFPVVRNVNPLILSPAIPQSLGNMLNGMGAALNVLAWPTANKAFYMPVSVYEPFLVAKMFVINGGTVSGNIDVGIYDRGGAKIVSSGSVAQAGASAIQEFDVVDTLLNPGLYYLACAMDNATGQLEVWNVTGGTIGRSLGLAEETTAFPLPSSATMAALTGTLRFPLVGATQRSVI